MNPSDRNRTMVRGTVEYLTGTVTADLPIGDDDAIAISFDRTTWLTAEWVGGAGTSREWRILLGGTTPLPSERWSTVYVKVTDSPEAPILEAGLLIIS